MRACHGWPLSCSSRYSLPMTRGSPPRNSSTNYKSAAQRCLSQVGIVGRERQPNSRRDRYTLRDHSWFEMLTRREQLLEQWIISARAGVAALGAKTPAGQRIAESLEFFEFLQGEMPAMLARWRAKQANTQRPSSPTRSR
jgi:hypothetical protein